MSQPLSLEELKIEAHKQNHILIRGEEQIAWRPLVSWKGHSTEPFVYYLYGDRVLAKKLQDSQEHWYRLA
jgi:hypothetical protein